MENNGKKSEAVIRNPGFFKSPPFWKSGWDEVNYFLDGIKKGSVQKILRLYR